MHVITRLVGIVNDTLLFGDLVIFVVACEDDHRGVISESFDYFLGLVFDVGVQLVVGWVLPISSQFLPINGQISLQGRNRT